VIFHHYIIDCESWNNAFEILLRQNLIMKDYCWWAWDSKK